MKAEANHDLTRKALLLSYLPVKTTVSTSSRSFTLAALDVTIHLDYEGTQIPQMKMAVI